MNQKSDSIVDHTLKRGMAAVEREEYHQALSILSNVYNEESTEPLDALSHYALCLAVVERKYKAALRLCQRAVATQFYNSVHYANTTRVLLAAGNRKRAVETLDQGLKRLPKDPILMALRERVGWRRKNVIPFLSRDNPMNIFLGKRRARARRKAGGDVAYAEEQKKRRGVIFYVAAVLGTLAYLALIVGIFLWIAE